MNNLAIGCLRSSPCKAVLLSRTYYCCGSLSSYTNKVQNGHGSQPGSIVPCRKISQAFYDQYLSPNFPPIGAAHSVLDAVHNFTGLPWWAVIALTTFGLRTLLTLPIMAYSYSNAARRALLEPEIKSIAIQLKTEISVAKTKLEWSDHIAKRAFGANMEKQIGKLYERDNCHPAKEYILPWIQVPLWISMSLALRNMAGAVMVDGHRTPVLYPELSTEGTLWFTNLLVPDSTLMLPLVMCLANLIITEMYSLRLTNPTLFQRSVTYLMRGMIVILLPIATSVPSCMCYYWTCSSLYGLAQNILLQLPRVRRALRITPAPNESQTPFRDLLEIARKKFSRAGKQSPGVK